MVICFPDPVCGHTASRHRHWSRHCWTMRTLQETAEKHNMEYTDPKDAILGK